MTCRMVQRQFLDITRQSATDALRLEVESHVQDCATCAAEGLHWKLVGLVRQHPTARLDAAAEGRIIRQVVSSAVVPDTARRRSMRRRPAVAIAGVSMLALAGVAVFVVGRRVRPDETAIGGASIGSAVGDRFGDPFGRQSAAHPGAAGAPVIDAVTEGQVVDAAEPGLVSFGGAEVRYRSGTRMSLHPAQRLLTLSSGEVDVEVTPGRPGRFRVTTERFIVEVLGTRFSVTPNRVRTVQGKVHVLDAHVLDGQQRELAVLGPGDAWDAPTDGAAPSPLPSLTEERGVGALLSPPPARPGAGRDATRAPGADVLTRSRAALARGEARQARGLAQGALASGKASGQVASFELLVADSLLVEKRIDDAIDGYRRVVRRNPRAAEAETAQFTIGQLLFERGAIVAATAALNDYLARYPVGRFVREAREDLIQLRSMK
ncbi:MAG: tetratricopeptide repeat protein [Haliangium ochraceum]